MDIFIKKFQVHTAVSRTVEALEDTTGVKFPSGDTVLHAYLPFEALTDHDYKFSCVTCGDHGFTQKRCFPFIRYAILLAW